MLEAINSVPDFRRDSKGNFRHSLCDIILLLIIARLAGCASRREVVAFAGRKHAQLKKLGILRNGIPSEPTLCRVENNVDPSEMERIAACIAEEAASLTKLGLLRQVAIDGKCMRGTTLPNGRCPDIVSAYSVETGTTLRTEPCEEKSNEITAVPKLLERMNLEGCIVTADAMSCQKKIIDAINSKGGKFLIEVKSNQKNLLWGLEDRLPGARRLDCHREEPTLRHGRIESRTCTTYDGRDLVADQDKWGYSITAIIIDTSAIIKKTGEETHERRVYITDVSAGAKTCNAISRSHWMIESMHWSLDKNLGQDSTKRKYLNGARVLDIIQRACLNIIAVWKSKRRKKSDREKGNARILTDLTYNIPLIKKFLALS